MSEITQQVDWFMPPEGILNGTNFDIALGYISRRRADEAHIAEHPLYGYTEHLSWDAKELEEINNFLTELEQRLLLDDEELANSLTAKVEQEVFELNSGTRGCVTGEAHLYFKRQKAIQQLSAIAMEDINV